MNDPTNDLLIDAIAQALETTAFLTVMPVEEDYQPPSSSMHISMDYAGTQSGSLEIVASESFGITLAASILGTDESDEDALSKAEDALKEILNITCGSLLPALADDPSDVFDITIPAVVSLDTIEQWNEYTKQESVSVIDIEGSPMAVRITAKG